MRAAPLGTVSARFARSSSGQQIVEIIQTAATPIMPRAIPVPAPMTARGTEGHAKVGAPTAALAAHQHTSLPIGRTNDKR